MSFMPILNQPTGTIILPERVAQLIPETDVLVVGGGPSGIAAALGAADAGAKVVLAERHGFLGGNATAGLVLTWASYYTSCREPKETTEHPDEFTIFPTDHGSGQPIIAGVLAKIVKRLIELGGAFAPSRRTGFMVPFDPEILKFVVLEMLDTAGVQLLFHAFASGTIIDKGLRGVVFETKSGPLVIKAKVIIDCTGDGDIAVGAIKGVEAGVLDSPFSINIHAWDNVLGIRDVKGACRYLEFGNLPLPEEIKDFHRQKLAEREALEGRKMDYHVSIEDFWAISKGKLLGVPAQRKR